MLEYMYRNTHNTTVLLDTFMDNYRNKNKTAKESLILSYVDATGDTSAKELNNKNESSVYITLTKGYLEHCNKYLTGGMHSHIDSENLADGFAARFSLGAELTSSLAKMEHIKFILRQPAPLMLVLKYTLIVFSIICMFLPYGFVFAAILTLINFEFLKNINNFLFKTTPIEDKDNVFNGRYDDALRRVQRIKNQTIKTMRESVLDKKEIKHFLDILDKIEQDFIFIKEKIGTRVSVLQSILNIIYSNKIEIKMLEQLTEDLMENNLYIAANRLKLYK